MSIVVDKTTRRTWKERLWGRSLNSFLFICTAAAVTRSFVSGNVSLVDGYGAGYIGEDGGVGKVHIQGKVPFLARIFKLTSNGLVWLGLSDNEMKRQQSTQDGGIFY